MTAGEQEQGPVADLVLEGGGVKGIALVGAVLGLAGRGYRFPRVAGTSAGAVVASVLAALQHRGEDLARLDEIARTLDYRRFRDRGFPGRLLDPLGPVGLLADGVSVLLEDGAYQGDYLSGWLSGVLGDLGVRRFGDLRTRDPGDDGTMHHQYALVVTASDVSRKRLVKLPWDYEPAYGLDPDEQPVAAAVRASASIPFFFRPVTLTGPRGRCTLVDGGLLSNYPITIFDRSDGRPPRWPTLGVRLDAFGLSEHAGPFRPVHGALALGAALVETAIEGSQAEHVLAYCNLARSIAVETGGVSAIDFSLTRAQQDRLLQAGRDGAVAFLAEWDFAEWRRRCRGGVL